MIQDGGGGCCSCTTHSKTPATCTWWWTTCLAETWSTSWAITMSRRSGPSSIALKWFWPWMLYTLWDLCTGEAHVTVLDITREVHVQKAVVTGDNVNNLHWWKYIHTAYVVLILQRALIRPQTDEELDLGCFEAEAQSLICDVFKWHAH